MDKVFLDANALFSAAYRPDAGLGRLWKLEGVQLVTSAHALLEASMNLDRDLRRTRLERLAKDVQVVESLPADDSLPEGVALAEKDRPILLAATSCGATHLLTGDVTHFGQYCGRRIGGVLILPPAEYLRRRG